MGFIFSGIAHTLRLEQNKIRIEVLSLKKKVKYLNEKRKKKFFSPISKKNSFSKSAYSKNFAKKDAIFQKFFLIETRIPAGFARRFARSFLPLFRDVLF